MAIIIAASQIYDILDNEKVIDNNVGGIDTSDDNAEENNGQISESITIYLYDTDFSSENSSSTYLDAYVPYIGDQEGNNDSSLQIEMETVGVENPPYPDPNRGSYRRDTFSIKLKFNIDKTIKIGTEIKLYTTTNIDYFKRNDDGTYRLDRQQTSKIVIQRFQYNGEDSIEINLTNQVGLYYIQQTTSDTSVLLLAYGTVNKQITYSLNCDYIDIIETEENYGTSPKISLENNELLQTTTTINNKKLSQYNYEQITAEWGEGKELATIKCSIGEYYEYDESADDHKGALAISTQNNDLPMIFNIGDLVIPYIAVANGQTEPLSIKLDGTPKVFKVTQIRPYFDGAFWQELVLQEHTK